MKKMVWFCILVLAGCNGGGSKKNEEWNRAKIDSAVAGWADAAERAERSKTAASGEHPVAVSEMKNQEETLREACASDAGRQRVRQSIDDRRAELDRKRKVAPPGGEMEKLDFQFKALSDLKSKLGF